MPKSSLKHAMLGNVLFSCTAGRVSQQGSLGGTTSVDQWAAGNQRIKQFADIYIKIVVTVPRTTKVVPRPTEFG